MFHQITGSTAFICNQFQHPQFNVCTAFQLICCLPKIVSAEHDTAINETMTDDTRGMILSLLGSGTIIGVFVLGCFIAPIWEKYLKKREAEAIRKESQFSLESDDSENDETDHIIESSSDVLVESSVEERPKNLKLH